MKRTVLTFGLISGVVSSVLILVTAALHDQIGFDKGVVVGYTGIVLSFLMVFFGVRSYRENVGDGKITFGRALSVGLLITLISCAFYVVTWEILYYNLMPDYLDKYATYMVEQLRASGASQQLIDAKIQEMSEMKVWMDNPLILAAIGFVEAFPVGLIISLISAVILRKSKSVSEQVVGEPLTNS
jgi:predicted GNAT family acetyltransferase